MATRRRARSGQVLPGHPFRAFGVGPGEVGVHSIDITKTPVVSDVIVVRVRIHHAHWQPRQFLDHLADIADAHAGVEEDRLPVSQDQIRNHLFRLMWLINGEYARTNFVNLKPRVGNFDAVQFGILGTRQIPAPLRFLREGESPKQDEGKEKEE